MTRRRLAAVSIAVLLWLQVPHAGAQPRRLGAVVAPVRLVPTGSTPIGISALQRYFGSIELDVASDGIVVSNRLTMEKYLLGLNEVPTDWPAEAMRAQAVAARTYALWTLQQGRQGSAATYGFDICATVDCQVFSGAEVVADGGGGWPDAVQSTAGAAILYEGSPILARYHSTSGGVTFDNPEGFPEEPAYPYLQGVSSTTETASPLFRWRVVFTLKHLRRILEHAGVWQGRVRSVRTVESSVGSPYPDVIVAGPRGGRRMVADDFRDAVREEAPAIYPDLYPSPWDTTSGRLPETLPSERFLIKTKSGRVIVLGRGWGHGVGMSQWGAYGLAQEGATYDQILHHYYTGVTIGNVETDIPIEVGVGYGRSDVEAVGAFTIVDGDGQTIVKNGVGTWRFTPAGEGVLAIDPPQGYGLPLEVGIVKAPKKVTVGEPAFLTIALSRPAEVRAETVGLSERFPKTRIKEAGKRRVTWLAPVEPGDYKVRVRVAIGKTTRFSKPIPISVRERPVAADQPETSPEDEGSFPFWIMAVGVIVVVSGALIAAARGERG